MSLPAASAHSLFAFGSNGNGQLGIGSDEDTSTPRPVRFTPPLAITTTTFNNDHTATTTTTPSTQPPFHDFAAGGNHTALITADHHRRLYMTGSNKDGESLLKDPTQVFTFHHSIPSKDTEQEQDQQQQQQQHKEHDLRWRSVACGWAFTIAVTEPDIITVVTEKDVSTSDREQRVHCTGNKVYAWGSGSFGELGLGQGLTKTGGGKAMVIETGIFSNASSDQFEILKVKAGLRHVLLLAKEKKKCSGGGSEEEEEEDGDGQYRTVLLGWGSNRQGQLGILERRLRPGGNDEEALPYTEKELRGKFMEPTRILLSRKRGGVEANVEDEDEPEMIDMACGQNHSLVLFSDGTVYSSGQNKYAQLGPRTVSEEQRKQDFRMGFQQVQGLPYVDSISCGWNHNAAMDTRSSTIAGGRTSTGIIYLWGRDDHGQLGGGLVLKVVDVDLSGFSSVPAGIVQVQIPRMDHHRPDEKE
ncbi:hypothetical protein BGZ58_003554, partial [Dissophora ornata]